MLTIQMRRCASICLWFDLVNATCRAHYVKLVPICQGTMPEGCDMWVVQAPEALHTGEGGPAQYRVKCDGHAVKANYQLPLTAPVPNPIRVEIITTAVEGNVTSWLQHDRQQTSPVPAAHELCICPVLGLRLNTWEGLQDLIGIYIGQHLHMVLCMHWVFLRVQVLSSPILCAVLFLFCGIGRRASLPPSA
jgi:hypothetical protein